MFFRDLPPHHPPALAPALQGTSSLCPSLSRLLLSFRYAACPRGRVRLRAPAPARSPPTGPPLRCDRVGGGAPPWAPVLGVHGAPNASHRPGPSGTDPAPVRSRSPPPTTGPHPISESRPGRFSPLDTPSPPLRPRETRGTFGFKPRNAPPKP